MNDSESGPRGCGVCDWDGKVAISHDYDHEYYTHVRVENGEVFQGKTCSQRTKPKTGFAERMKRRLL